MNEKERIQKAYENMLKEDINEAKLTRQHFIALAELMKRAKTLDNLKSDVIQWLAAHNPNFDEDRFRKAAGMSTGKPKYEIRKAGDGYSLTGPLKAGQKYHDRNAPKVRSGASDGLWDTYEQAEKQVKKLGGEVRSKEEMHRIYSK